MSAPSGTQWSSVSTGTKYQGCIGLYVDSSNSKTQTEVTVQIWYWSQYSCQDSSNTFYFDWDSSASSSIGSRNINTSSGHSWDTANQVLIGTYSKTYDRYTSSYIGTCSARFTGIEYGGGNSYTANVNFTIPAVDRYTITYHGNGGLWNQKDSWSEQVYYGSSYVTQKNFFTRNGYVFKGWRIYERNVDLYAVWDRISCAVKFDAGSNGGTVNGYGSIVRTVYYGDRLGELPTAKRLNYEFLGWNTNQNGSGSYIEETSIITANITLYAIFKLQANCYTKQSSKYKTGMMYRKDGKYSTGIVKVKVNGKYSTGIVKVKVNGKYKDATI